VRLSAGTPFVVFFSAKVFYARKILRIFLIGHKKSSFTTRTLSEMGAGLIYKNNKMIKNVHF